MKKEKALNEARAHLIDDSKDARKEIKSHDRLVRDLNNAMKSPIGKK